MKAMKKPFAIYTDIGGTNSRVAVQYFRDSSYENVEIYKSNEFNSPSEVILQYLKNNYLQTPKHIVIAIACPISGDKLKMANLHWHFSITETKEILGTEYVHFINDFEAIANSIPYLQENEKIKIGGGRDLNFNNPVALIGPGTGVGVATLIKTNLGGKSTNKPIYKSIPTEGGHVLYPPQDLEEIEILKVIMQTHHIVGLEHVLSGGHGIKNLIYGVATVHGYVAPNWDAKELFEQGLTHKNKLALKVISRYCAMLGNAAGNVALTTGSIGGLFICGGIVPRLGNFFLNSRFRECFENKGLATHYIEAIPTFLVTAEFPAFIGDKHALEKIL